MQVDRREVEGGVSARLFQWYTFLWFEVELVLRHHRTAIHFSLGHFKLGSLLFEHPKLGALLFCLFYGCTVCFCAL